MFVSTWRSSLVPRFGILVALGAGLFLPCEAQQTAWQILNDGDPRYGNGKLVYDEQAGTPLRFLYGSDDSPVMVWALEGDDWRRRFPGSPSPLGLPACAAYDSVRKVTVLFSENGTTWEYDGESWAEVLTAVAPTPRGTCGMAFDAGTGRTVLFGGDTTSDVYLGDTWEFDGQQWTEVFSSVSPSPRSDVDLAYDSDRGVIVLFGGQRDADFLFKDTWEYSNGQWVERTPPGPSDSPTQRSGVALAYDPNLQRTVLFGGSGISSHNDTWTWDGVVWERQSPSASPPPRELFQMVFDGSRQKIVGTAGLTLTDGFNDTWEYDGTTWTEIAISPLPKLRYEAGMAFDGDLRAPVLYGGWNPTDGDLWDTWHFVQGKWELQPEAGQPSHSELSPLDYDPVHHRVAGMGGLGSGWSRDVHVYENDPRRWFSEDRGGPDTRYNHGWVYSGDLGGFLLFGGKARDQNLITRFAHDTWILDGDTWIPRHPEHFPPGRLSPAMAYERHSGRVLLYGGSWGGFYDFYDDMWAYDGNDWVQLFDGAPPGGRAYANLVYDPSRQVSVLFGKGPIDEQVTWEFDGTAWHARPTPLLPDPDRLYASMTYDPDLEVVLLFGGRLVFNGALLNDTWAYGADPDGDGVVGRLDNCVETANAGQENGDGDPAGDACDCAPSDDTAFSVPAEVSGVMIATDTETIRWDSAAPGAGSGTTHDVVRGSLAELPVGSGSAEICLESGLAASETTDPEAPSPGTGVWYLVRGRNACGAGTYGAASGGEPRTTATCP